MISRSTIDRVFETARVEEVIADFVQLKKSGSNLKGLSPFNHERTPSFVVNPVKQIWKDFSSGKGGSVVNFLMEHEHFTYPEAVRWLAKKYQIEVEEEGRDPEAARQAGERESLYVVNQYAQRYFEEALWETERGKAIGLSYFRERGFTDATIRGFGLGYNPDEWTAFTDAARKEGHGLEYLSGTGLTIVKEQPQGPPRTFDRFKGRVMFPIHSLSGRILGFGGRILTQDKRAAKYINSPESPVYHKGQVVYGLYQAKKAVYRERNCYLVEGYTDVIQMHQLGIENTVSTSGTALTPEQVRLIKRFTSKVTLLFDGDAAGLRAALKGVDLVLAEGLQVQVCLFPEGEDPDSFARKHRLEEVREYLESNVRDFIDLKISVLMEEAKDDPHKKAETLHDIVGSIARIPDPVTREFYVQRCARLMTVPERVLFDALAQRIRRDADQARKNRGDGGARTSVDQGAAMAVVRDDPGIPAVDGLEVLERQLVEILFLYGSQEKTFREESLKEGPEGELVTMVEKRKLPIYEKISMELQADEIEFANPGFRKIFRRLVQGYREALPDTADQLLRDDDPELSAVLGGVLMESERYALHDWERRDIFPKSREQGLVQAVEQTLLRLRCHLIEERLGELQASLGVEGGDDRARMEDIKDYLELNRLLNQRLNRVVSWTPVPEGK